jgi:hypothetical protein
MIHRMQTTLLHAGLDGSEAHNSASASTVDAAAVVSSSPDFAGLADADVEDSSVETPHAADVQLSRVQAMRLRMRRQLDAQLACTAQKRMFLGQEVNLMDAEFGIGAFVNKHPPTINAGERGSGRALVFPFISRFFLCFCVRSCVHGLAQDAHKRER